MYAPKNPACIQSGRSSCPLPYHGTWRRTNSVALCSPKGLPLITSRADQAHDTDPGGITLRDGVNLGSAVVDGWTMDDGCEERTTRRDPQMSSRRSLHNAASEPNNGENALVSEDGNMERVKRE